MSAAPGRRAHEAGDRGQGGPACRGRAGRRLAYRRAGRHRMRSTTPRSGAPACCGCSGWRSCSMPSQTLAAARRPRGDRLAILTNGGGAGVLATDALIDRRRQARRPRAGDDRAARQRPAATWSRGNPVDIIGDAPARALRRGARCGRAGRRRRRRRSSSTARRRSPSARRRGAGRGRGNRQAQATRPC